VNTKAIMTKTPITIPMFSSFLSGPLRQIDNPKHQGDDHQNRNDEFHVPLLLSGPLHQIDDPKYQGDDHQNCND
jgi:hypothetical protein